MSRQRRSVRHRRRGFERGRRSSTVEVSRAAIFAICAAGIGGVLIRPRGLPEWVSAVLAALALAVFGLVPPRGFLDAVLQGTNVYLFLTGMMLLAETARRGGVFDWVAGIAVSAAAGSRFKLFALVYLTGVAVTIVLSNDATAVVLTPAVAAAVRRAKAEPLPYLFACAFVANAASFVLPISNPANLVVFAGDLPPLARWIASFALPSFASIAATFGMLALISRRALRGMLAPDPERPALGAQGRLALGSIGLTAVALVAASAFGASLGGVACAGGVAALIAGGLRERASFAGVTRAVSWSVLLLVAGLFVLVRALDSTGLVAAARHASESLAALPAGLAMPAVAGVAAAASNAMNNLPAGLIAGGSVAGLHGHEAFRSAVAIGIDLGPNLSVTGSLATVLWLIELRRQQIAVDAWTFLRAGALVMPPALVLAVESLLLTSR